MAALNVKWTSEGLLCWHKTGTFTRFVKICKVHIHHRQRKISHTHYKQVDAGATVTIHM